MLRLATNDDYPVVSFSVVSLRGGDPDVTANALLRRYNFQVNGGVDPAHLLSRNAVPPEDCYDKCFVKVRDDPGRSTFATFLLAMGEREFTLDKGRVRIESDPVKGSGNKILIMEGTMAQMDEWRFVCKPPEGMPPPPVIDRTSSAPLDIYNIEKERSSPVSSRPVKDKTKREKKESIVPVVLKANGNGEGHSNEIILINPPVIIDPNLNSSPDSSSGNGKKTTIADGQIVIKDILVDRIRRNVEQPRRHFHPGRLRLLGESLLNGQEEPIEVIEVVGDQDADFELIKGERRLRAAMLVGIKSLTARVRSKKEIPDKGAQFRACVIADHNREGYTKLETAWALLRRKKEGATVRELTSEFSKTDCWVYQHLSLNDLVPEIQKLLDPDLSKRNRLSVSIAFVLAKLPKEKQMEAYKEVIAVSGARFQLLKAREIAERINPNKSKGRRRKPADYVERLSVMIPRVAADAVSAERFPPSTFNSLVTHGSALDVDTMLGQIDQAIIKLGELSKKIKQAIKQGRA